MHPGDIIAGKYRVANVLGRGRGLLLEARHTEFDQRVVIRLLSPHLCDEKQLEQFRREARTLSKLESEHVARIIDVGTHSDGSFFFVRQHLEGVDLATHIRSQGALRLEEAVLYILQAAEAVQETHSHNIVLRELQPAHLFITRRRGGAPLVKVTDFGTAKVLKDPNAQAVNGEMTATVMFGMSNYSSPELVRKARDIDHRTDVWSLGCILYEMLTAMTPFQGEMAELMLKITREEPIPLSSLRPDLPQEIDQIMAWALAKDRNARFSSVYAFAHALKPYASAEGQVLIDQIGRLAHAKGDDPSTGQISPTSPLAKRSGRPMDDEDATVIRQVPGYGGAAEHDFERTQFMGDHGSVPPPPASAPGSVPGRGSVPPPPGSYSGRGSVPPPAMGSQPGSVPPPAMGSAPGSVPPPRARQGSWVEADPAAASGLAAAAQTDFGAAASAPKKKKGRGLVIALAAALVLLPVAVVAGILAMRSGAEGDEVAQADTKESQPDAEPAPPITDEPDTDDETPTATDDGASDKPDDEKSDDEKGDEEESHDEKGDEETSDGSDDPDPKTAEAPTPPPVPSPVSRPKPSVIPDSQVSSQPKKKKKKKKKAPPPPSGGGGTGTLVAIAIGGSCAFAVDGAPKGTKSSIRIKVPVGNHTVSCTPPKKATRTQSVNVKEGKPGIASFRLN